MGEICYQIKEIPDLTLGKYAYLSENGVDGVLNLHTSFLWQWHEKSRLTGVSIHLIYVYKASEMPGQKIKTFFIARGDDDKLNNVDMILKGATLSEYFDFKFVYKVSSNNDFNELLNDAECAKDVKKSIDFLNNDKYKWCCALTKEEIFFTGSDGRTYYNVPNWEPNEEGRLYEMFRMMGTLDEDCVFRIDLLATKKNKSLRKVLTSGPIPGLHSLQSNMNGERDYGADTVLHSYDQLMKNLDSNPHFQVNVFTFSNNKENGSLVISAATSEAIEEGDYHISRFAHSFSAREFFGTNPISLNDMDDATIYKLDFDGKNTSVISEELENSSSKSLKYLNNLFTLEEVAPLFRFPCLFDGETINVRKETVAPHVDSDNSLYLGRDGNGYEINFPLKLLPKHAFISGVPGSGKTNTMHHLTHSLLLKDIPFLVLEPAKKEYRALCNLYEKDLGEENNEKIRKLKLFSPGVNMTFPLHINPFEFAKGLSVAEHIRSLCDVFEGAFPLDNPMPFLLDTAIEGVYRDNGWRPDDVYTDETDLSNKPFPTMSMLYKRLEEELANTTYSGEVRGNLESALKVRIGSLLRREMGDVFDVKKSSLAPEEWLTTPSIIELESMGSGPANFLTLMLCSLIRECLKTNPVYDDKGKGTRHVIFIEEAHNLIGPDSEVKTGEGANAKTAATAFIVKMLAEVRALKESVFIADQLPTAMAPEVIKNTGLKIALRLTAMDDRQLLCNSMSANSSQMEDMGNFSIGEALISYEKLQRPFKMRIKEWCGEMNEAEKEATKTSLDDESLFEVLKDTDSYRSNIERSVVVASQRLYPRFLKLKETLHEGVKEYEKYVTLLKEREDLRIEYDSLCATVLEKGEMFGLNDFDISEDEDTTENKRFLEIGAELSNLDKATEKQFKECLKYFNWDDIMLFINDVAHTIKHYNKLGVRATNEELKAIYEGRYNEVRPFIRCYQSLHTVFIQEIYNEICLMFHLAKACNVQNGMNSSNIEAILKKICNAYKLDNKIFSEK